MRTLAYGVVAMALLGAGLTAEQAAKAPAAQAPAVPQKMAPSHPATNAPGTPLARVAPAGLSTESQNQLVGQYCATCHSDRGKAGGLTLASFDAAKIEKNAETGEKMIRKLRAGMMPPPGARKPDAAAVKAFVDALETKIDAAAALNPNPG